MHAVLSQHADGLSPMAFALPLSYTIDLGWPTLYGILDTYSHL